MSCRYIHIKIVTSGTSYSTHFQSQWLFYDYNCVMILSIVINEYQVADNNC